MSKLMFNPDFKYSRVYGKISGYTTSYNSLTMGYPFRECIRSMLGVCDEVVVVDGSTDGTYEILEQMATDDPRIQLYQNEWSSDPGVDGNFKAFGRALCQHDFCLQMDLDEVIHEADYEKFKMITKRFPTQAPILSLPVIECWGDEKHFTGRRHSWKWRLSKNLPELTHGINKHARLIDEQTGEVYAREGMSDGCEYVNVITYDPIPHVGFYNQQIEQLRLTNPEMYGKVMNQVFNQLPSIFHYSWFNLKNKINQFSVNWDNQWNNLYKTQNKKRFPDFATQEELDFYIKKMYDQGGENSDQIKYKCLLERPHPAIMTDWIEKNRTVV